MSHLPTPRFDFFMMTAELTYVRDDVAKQRRMNTLLQLPKAVVTYAAINEARMATMQRLEQEHSVPMSEVKDFVILNISHLGRCTPEEFHGQAASKKSPKHYS